MIVISELALEEERIPKVECSGAKKKIGWGKWSGWDLNTKILFSIAAHLD
jgi:hypothetical protein